MRDIIAEAHKARYTVSEENPKKQGIAISYSWLAELEKHPYHSSKTWLIIFVVKPGTGIFLMKESSKLYRPHKEREPRKLGKRLGGPTMSAAEVKTSSSHQLKRQNLGAASLQSWCHRNQET